MIKFVHILTQLQKKQSGKSSIGRGSCPGKTSECGFDFQLQSLPF